CTPTSLARQAETGKRTRFGFVALLRVRGPLRRAIQPGRAPGSRARNRGPPNSSGPELIVPGRPRSPSRNGSHPATPDAPAAYIPANSRWSRQPRYQSTDDGAPGSTDTRGWYGSNLPSRYTLSSRVWGCRTAT